MIKNKKIITERVLAKLHPPNLALSLNVAIDRLCKIQFWEKLFAIGFP